MTDLVYTSSAAAVTALQDLGLDVDIEIDESQKIKDNKYIINPVYNDDKTVNLIKDTGKYTISAGIIKNLKAGYNIEFIKNDDYIEINALSGISELDAIGDIQYNLPIGFTLSQILGDIPNNNYDNSNTFVKKISDLQEISENLGLNKADKTNVDNISIQVNNIINTFLLSSIYDTFVQKLGDISGFSTTNTIIQRIASKASITSLNTVINDIADIQSNKAEKVNLENLNARLGSLITPPGGIQFNSSRTLMDSLGDLSIYDSNNTLISLLGDLTFIKNTNDFSSLVDYIQTIDSNASNDLLNYKQNNIGDLSNINNINVGYTLSDLIGNPIKSHYTSNGALNDSQIIDFENDTFYSNSPLSDDMNNKLTITNILE